MWSTAGMAIRRPLITALSTAGLSAATLLLAACGDSGDSAGVTDGSADIADLVVEDGQSNDHVDNATYDVVPPSGGDHNAIWLNCGLYDIEVPDDNAVHTLEHGVVWVAHDPDLAADQMAALRELFDANADRMIVSPVTGLDSAVVVVAWERRLELDDATDPRLAAFVDTFTNGAQAPEPRAACEGGIGPAS